MTVVSRISTHPDVQSTSLRTFSSSIPAQARFDVQRARSSARLSVNACRVSSRF